MQCLVVTTIYSAAIYLYSVQSTTNLSKQFILIINLLIGLSMKSLSVVDNILFILFFYV